MKLRKTLYYLAPAVFGLLLALFYAVHAYWLDDWEFCRFFNIKADGSFGLPDLATLRSLLGERWRTDSFRLCNLAIPPLLLLPRWLTATLMGAIWYLFIILGLRLMRVNSWRSVWLAVGLMSVLPAWWAYLPTLSSNVNYVTSLLIAVCALWLLLRENGPGKVAAVFLGVLGGWWHEGLSAPLIAAFILVMWLHPQFRSKRNLWFTTGLIIGFMLLNVNPGFLYRLNMVGAADGMYSTGSLRLLNLAINCVLPAAFFFISLKFVPHITRTALWQALAATMAVSLMLEALTGIVRASFLSQYLSCLAVIWISSEAWHEKYKALKTMSAITGMVICVLTFGTAIFTGIKVDKFNHAYIEAHLNHPGETVFTSAVLPGEAHPLTMGKSPAMIYQLPAFHYVYPVDFATTLDTKVIPDIFADFEPGRNGWNTTLQGNWRKGFAFIMPYEGEAVDRWRRVGAEVTFPVIGKVRMVLNALPFRGADGNIYLAVIPNELPPYLPAPSDVRITLTHGFFSFW